MQETLSLLILIGLFQVKHLLADFYMQTAVMLSGRETYWHLGRAMHAGVHAAMSAVVLLIMGTPVSGLLALIAAEFFVHFHVDFWKARHSVKHGYTPADAAFWRAFGFDQSLHQLTYLVMAWFWLTL